MFSGFDGECLRLSGALALRASIRSTVRCASSQASSSVGAMIGRNATWILGTSVLPASLAACLTDSICCAVSASGSPHRQKMSASAPPAA
ncbi:hypothetical protein SAMN05216188_109171 [Lentzea xinjiangensis]|uniref:Uncharacterized protein n=1 Tax=Lentzea xinjiangensis TaxID=402600 RepID=A0A1H9MPF1_9PSEU|nr:hypothetical protein SAMN05216188_109171 [Lentzea xinjiangensis]